MSDILEGLGSRKVVLIGLACAASLVALVAGACISALLEDQNSDTREALAELGGYHAKVAARPAVEAAYRLALVHAAAAPGLIHAGNAALAEAEMEKEVKAIASKAGADVRRAQALSATKASGFESIAVAFDMSVPASRLRDLAYAVETHSPYYFVDDITVSAPNWQVADPKSSDPALDLRWTIRGYRWNSGS